MSTVGKFSRSGLSLLDPGNNVVLIDVSDGDALDHRNIGIGVGFED
jgi:hypothetical protein